MSLNLRVIYRFALAVAVIAALVIFHRYILASLLPFFIAFVLAGLMEPGIRLLQEKLRFPRPVAVIAVFTLCSVVGGYATFFVTAKILSELVDMSGQAGVYQATVVEIGSDLLERLSAATDDELLPPQIQAAISNAIETVSEQAEHFARSSIQSLLDTFVALPGVTLVIVITLIATYFIAKDRELISRSLFRVAPARLREPLRKAQEHIVVDMVGFLKAQFILFLITTAETAVGLYLIGSRYWMTLALVAGILDFIPVVGPGFLLVPWAAVSVLLGDIRRAVWLILLYSAIFLTRQTLQPKILGDSIGVHPLLMLAAIYAGTVTFGVRGLIIGPALVIIVRALLAAGLIRLPDDEAGPDRQAVPAQNNQPEAGAPAEKSSS